jgi:excinuclease UvrABC ATPase subunit
LSTSLKRRTVKLNRNTVIVAEHEMRVAAAADWIKTGVYPASLLE